MKKFIVTKNGKEIKLGDRIILTFNTDSPFGTIEVEKNMLVTEAILKKLIADKKVKVVDISDNTKHNAIWDAAILSLSEKTGWKLDKLDSILSTIESINFWAAIQIILKELAIELDKKYENHINESEEIYAISPQDGKIHKLNKKTIKSYRAFPAFRNIEDAKIARNLIKNNLKKLFKSEEQ